jgi:mannitol-1-phosphate 5-dehydrogenase
MDDLIHQLNAQHRYRVMIVDTHDEEIWVEQVRAVNGKDAEAVIETLAHADIAATAVGSNALPYLYPNIARALQRRYKLFGLRPLDIILAENLRHAADIVRAGLRAHLPEDFPLEQMLGLVETSIGKMVPIMTEAQRQVDPLLVFAEAYNQLILDAAAFKNPIPAVPGLSPKENMTAYVDRKLFVHNLGHAAVAYLGYQADPSLTYIWQVTGIPEVRAAAEAAMWESARALCLAYPDEFTIAQLSAHIDDLLRRFTNRALGDTVFRVGRDLRRKLSREDRIIGAMRFDQAHGIPYAATARVAASALEFRGTDAHGHLSTSDVTFVESIYPQGLEAICTQVCRLDLAQQDDRPLAEAIILAHQELPVQNSPVV